MQRYMFRMIFMAATCFPMLANDDLEAAKQVVVKGYVEGIHINADPDAIRKGFHKDFVMLRQRKDSVIQVTRDEWIARIEAGAEKRKARPPRDVKYKIPNIEISGHAAVARVEMYFDGKHIFTDFLSLYRFAEGWRIVSKTYYLHPQKK